MFRKQVLALALDKNVNISKPGSEEDSAQQHAGHVTAQESSGPNLAVVDPHLRGDEIVASSKWVSNMPALLDPNPLIQLRDNGSSRTEIISNRKTLLPSPRSQSPMPLIAKPTIAIKSRAWAEMDFDEPADLESHITRNLVVAQEHSSITAQSLPNQQQVGILPPPLSLCTTPIDSNKRSPPPEEQLQQQKKRVFAPLELDLD